MLLGARAAEQSLVDITTTAEFVAQIYSKLRRNLWGKRFKTKRKRRLRHQLN